MAQTSKSRQAKNRSARANSARIAAHRAGPIYQAARARRAAGLPRTKLTVIKVSAATERDLARRGYFTGQGRVVATPEQAPIVRAAVRQSHRYRVDFEEFADRVSMPEDQREEFLKAARKNREDFTEIIRISKLRYREYKGNSARSGVDYSDLPWPYNEDAQDFEQLFYYHSDI